MIKKPKNRRNKKKLQETESVRNVPNKNVTKINNEKRNLSVIFQKREHVAKMYLENNTIGNC